MLVWYRKKVLTSINVIWYYEIPLQKIFRWKKLKKVVDKSESIWYPIKVADDDNGQTGKRTAPECQKFRNAPWQINSNATLKIPRKRQGRPAWDKRSGKLMKGKGSREETNCRRPRRSKEAEGVGISEKNEIRNREMRVCENSTKNSKPETKLEARRDWQENLKSWRNLTWEFDPGSGWTLAACLTHASRTDIIWNLVRIMLVADGWVTLG